MDPTTESTTTTTAKEEESQQQQTTSSSTPADTKAAELPPTEEAESSVSASETNNHDAPPHKNHQCTLSTMETLAGSDDDKSDEPEQPSLWVRLGEIYRDNEFLILVICAILLARAYSPLGAEYLVPEITATWIAVCIIFVLAGLGLKTDEFSKAFQKIWFNLFVQAYNFGFVSFVIYAGSRGLEAANILSTDLADGMVVSACLPMTINMVLVLTKASGGDESLAIVNAASGNLVGVFLSPVLILGYLGVTGDIDLAEVFYKLALRVVLPVAVGQVIQKTMPQVVAFQKKHKKQFKKFQEYCLVFVVYTVFCRTFEDGSDSSIGDVFLMILFIFLFLISFMAIAWLALGLLFPNAPEQRVMGLFGCTHKTVAMGVPLINAIYEDNSAVGLYTLPLLIWHPMQLVIGTFLAPRLAAFVEQEKIRLGHTTPSVEAEASEPAATPPSVEAIPDEPSSVAMGNHVGMDVERGDAPANSSQ